LKCHSPINKTLSLFWLLIIVFFLTQKGQGQIIDDTTQYCIETIDGNVFIGKLESSDSSAFRINTGDYGIVLVKTGKVDRIYQINETKDGKRNFWHHNIQSARYFWAPNGYGLKKGEGYYQNYWVLFNQISYGFTDNFSVGVGMLPLFVFGGTPTPVWITPKFSVPIVKNKINMGVGGLFGVVLGENENSIWFSLWNIYLWFSRFEF